MAKAKNIDAENIVRYYLELTKHIETDELNSGDIVKLSNMGTNIREQMLFLHGSQQYFDAVEALKKFEQMEDGPPEDLIRFDMVGRTITFQNSFDELVTFTKNRAMQIKKETEEKIAPLDIKIALINSLYNNGDYGYSEKQLDTLLSDTFGLDPNELILNIGTPYPVVKESFTQHIYKTKNIANPLEQYPDATKILKNSNSTLKNSVIQRTKQTITEYLNNKTDDNDFIAKLYDLLLNDVTLVGNIFAAAEAHKNGNDANPVHQNTAEPLNDNMNMSTMAVYNMNIKNDPNAYGGSSTKNHVNDSRHEEYPVNNNHGAVNHNIKGSIKNDFAEQGQRSFVKYDQVDAIINNYESIGRDDFAEQGSIFVYDPGAFKTIDGNEWREAAKKQTAIEVARRLNNIMTEHKGHYISDFNGMISEALEAQNPTIVINACIEYFSPPALEQLVNAMHMYWYMIFAKTKEDIRPLIELVQKKIDSQSKNEDGYEDEYEYEYEDNHAAFDSLSAVSFNNGDDDVELGGNYCQHHTV